jgi:hypothetical protein
MLKRPLFILVLEDETVFAGGDYTNTKWNKIPINKKIKRLFYSLPNKDYICLEGYDTYYHMIEATIDLNGKKAGQLNIEFAYIMGKKEGKITCYKIDLKQITKLERTEYNESDSFISGLNKNAWK